MTIHELITEEMKKQKLTAHKLAKQSGVDGANAYRFVHATNGTGKRPGFHTVMKLMRALKIDTDRLNEVEI